METESTIQTVQIKRFQCRHILTEGHRCGSPSLRGEQFCYFHHATRRAADPRRRHARINTPEIPVLEDRAALLLSIGEVLQCISARTIDTKTAGLLLYGLQIANSALPRERGRPGRDEDDEDDLDQLGPVEDTVCDDELGVLAPAAEFLGPEQKEEHKSMARRMLDDVERYEARQRELKQQELHRAEIAAAVAEAVEIARTETATEAYAEIQNLTAVVRAMAIEETEARLRAQFNLPAPESLTIQALADPQSTSPNQAGSQAPKLSPLRPGCSKKHKSLLHGGRRAMSPDRASVAALPLAMSGMYRFDPTSTTAARKIESHGTPNPRPFRHRTLRRLLHLRQQVSDGSRPGRSCRTSGP